MSHTPMDLYDEYTRHFEPIKADTPPNKVLTGAAFPQLDIPHDKTFDSVRIIRYSHAWVLVRFFLGDEGVYRANFDTVSGYAGWPLWSNLPRWLKEHGWYQTSIYEGVMYHANVITDPEHIGALIRDIVDGQQVYINRPIEE